MANLGSDLFWGKSCLVSQWKSSQKGVIKFAVLRLDLLNLYFELMISCNEGESHSYYGRLEMDFGRNEIFNVPPVHFIQLTLAMSVSTRNFTAFSFSRGVQFDSKASRQSRGICNIVFH